MAFLMIKKYLLCLFFIILLTASDSLWACAKSLMPQNQKIIKVAFSESELLELNNALLNAAKDGYPTLVKLLLDAGANVNHQDKDGQTALTKATSGLIGAVSGVYSPVMLNIVRMLLAARANPNIQDKYGTTPLIFAVKYENIELVKLLLDAGANVNHQNKDGDTALIMASGDEFWNYLCRRTSSYIMADIIKLLLAKGANPNFQNHLGMTALMSASSNGHTEIVRLLLTAGANVNLQNHLGWTALNMARDCDHTEIVGLLKGAGATG